MRPDEAGRQSLPNAFRTAFAGIGDFTRERNSRIQMAAGVAAVLLGVVLKISADEWIILTFVIVGVLSLEAMNCAVERVIDLVSPGHHELARQAKDLAAGAVLIASIGATVVGALLFVPRIIALWRTWG